VCDLLVAPSCYHRKYRSPVRNAATRQRGFVMRPPLGRLPGLRKTRHDLHPRLWPTLPSARGRAAV
jgi:hypothetical protein